MLLLPKNQKEIYGAQRHRLVRVEPRHRRKNVARITAENEIGAVGRFPGTRREKVLDGDSSATRESLRKRQRISRHSNRTDAPRRQRQRPRDNLVLLQREGVLKCSRWQRQAIYRRQSVRAHEYAVRSARGVRAAGN